MTGLGGIPWGALVGRLLIEGVLLSGMAWLGARAVRSFAGQRLIWRATLAGIGLLFCVELADLRPRWRVEVLKTSVAVVARGEVVAQPVPDPAVKPVVGPLVPAAPARGAEEGPVRESGASVPWPALVWLAGTVGCLLRLGWGRVGLWRWVRRGWRLGVGGENAADLEFCRTAVERLRVPLGLGPVRLWVGDALQGPVAFGIRRPTVVLPVGFVRRFGTLRSEAMLAHELAHLAAKDPFWLLLSDLVRALAWWHPAVVWVCRKLRATSELAADEAAAWVPGGREALAESLVTFGRELLSPGTVRGLGVAGDGFRSQLARRVVALLQPGEASRPWGAGRQGAVYGLTLVAVAAGATAPGPGRDWGGVGGVMPALFAAAPAPGGTPAATAQVSAPTPSGGAGQAGNAPLSTNAAPAAARTIVVDTNRIVSLEVKFVEIHDRGAQDLGLDWLFGQSPTNNPVEKQQRSPGHVADSGNPAGPNFRIDVLELGGQSVTLSEVQFAALLRRLEGRGGLEVKAAPRVTTYSGQQAQVQIQEPRTVFVGVETVQGSPTNVPHVNYRTQPFQVGQAVDIIPVVKGDTIHLRVLATTTEFLGYDDPGVFVPAPGGLPGQPAGPPGLLPLPRIRVRSTATEATAEAPGTPATPVGTAPTGPVFGAVARSGETLVLRGPQVTETIRYSDKVPRLSDIPMIGRFFHQEGTNIVTKRLYVFVTPVIEQGQGSRPPAAETTQPSAATPASPDPLSWQPWSPDAVATARNSGHPVLVDFTADWCLSCKVNERTSIAIEPVRRRLAELGAAMFRGDHTRASPAITEELKRFGRAGLPLVLVYPRNPNLEPIVLPEVLTPALVLEALDQAGR
jgi:Flp pilus assembly secretin CpaC